MADQELKEWCKDSVPDPVKGNSQKRPLTDEEFLQGWGRLSGISPQQLNSLFNLITQHSPPTDTCPFPHLASKPIPSTALHMNGQAITSSTSPELHAFYGNTLTDMSASNLAGFIWIVRNH